MPTAFYETYRRLCQKAGKSDNAVAAEIGLSNSTVTTWRQGALPRRPTIKKVADYFGITVEEMMGYSDTQKKSAIQADREQVRLEGTYLRLAQGAQELGLDDEDVDAILAIYAKHKQRNQ